MESTMPMNGLIQQWPQYLAAGLLVLVRLSGLIAFAPLFGSAAIAPRIKAGFVIAMTLLLAPVVAAVPGARAVLDMQGVLGELGVGLVFGLSLALMNEALQFAGMLLGMQFSFSLVNLLDPNSMIETPVLGQMLGWIGLLVIIGAGLDRTLIAAMTRSFCIVPVGTAMVHARTGAALASMTGGVFLAGLQLASPVIAAALAIEVTIAMISRLAPQLPAMVISIPLKTMVSYVVLVGSLALWPGWIEQHFISLLDAAGRLIGAA
ncbi:flagellar biosynthetic protein FliR [Granulicella arctica]|uniref:Flagellar biosynthetic protein FliR n=1 Tax=Granulicella arctica TaxID=940613 RepID=A0A7Y9TLP9_9BACT|nr:flagellar biosynthetic protein FliR [Granulicella arctica]NYF80352.1 flagellar biosynthetic protein FliR [Granulicella arctica]